ncbi:uncharacterized protein EV154DRAFT_494641 [Mucor mucedo]|uniref:uncharacterized protein n=1 Tax=Mucor mucedo TaxID=29922 RepID=UPI00222033F8|nr:uncharacterized protein EV154DRAFT_494641 [Mucor mucedo]KAI7895701.1 hypothetical protein EV154DRAFT_494641 [Mucor mucedo]
MFIQDLPIEIVQQIIQNLPKRDALNCMRVCKAWHEPAAATFYKELVVIPSNIPKLTMVLNQRVQFPELERWTKLLTIQYDDNYVSSEYGDDTDYDFEAEAVQYTLNSETFFKLLSKLPQLKTLNLVNSAQTEHYLELIAQADRELPQFEAILPGPLSENERYDYSEKVMFRFYYQFRKSLKFMEIKYRHVVNEEKTMRGAYLLSKFSCLTVLNIEDTSLDSDVSCVEILNACPTLESLFLKRQCQVPDSVFDKKCNRKLTKLKSLNLDIPQLSSACVKYLIHCAISDNLEKLNITLSSDDIVSWINREDEDILLDFSRKLSFVEAVWFDSFRVNSGVTTLRPIPTVNMTKLYSVMNAINGKRRVEYQGSFSDSLYGSTLITIMDNKNFSSFDIISGCLEDNKLDWLVPDTSVSVIGPEKLNHIIFEVKQSKEPFGLHLLKFMMANCPNIKTGCIKTGRSKTATLRSTLKLEAKGSTFGMTLTGPFPDSKIFGSISTYVPRMKYLRIERPCENRNDEDDSKFSLDLTALSDMKKVIIIIDFEGREVKGMFCAVFKFPGNDTVHCYSVCYNPGEAYTQKLDILPEAGCDNYYGTSARRVLIQCNGLKQAKVRVKPQYVYSNKSKWVTRLKLSFIISK